MLTAEEELNAIMVPLSEKLRTLLNEAEMRGYQRGQDEARREILALLQGGQAPSRSTVQHSVSEGARDILHVGRAINFEPDDDESLVPGRKRAPKGLPVGLTDRALKDRPQGSTPRDIIMSAKDDYERMIKESTIRSVLRKGREAGRYAEKDGLWYLVGQEGSEI